MKFLYTALSLLFIYSISNAQNPTIYHTSLEKFKKEYPQEKTFIQSDKKYYFAGETIWLKAWCTLDEAPSYLSKILYVDLVNSKGDVIEKKMLQLDSLGSTGAEFDISNKIQTGNYSLNAYTLWMLNFPQFVGKKEIFIYGSDVKKETSSKTKASIKMYFFPEGGNIIAGVKNRIAFKICDDQGNIINASGAIANNKRETITNFTAIHEGMGTFDLEAKDGENYTANIALTNGSTFSYKLPNIQKEGVALRIENSNPNRFFVFLNRGESNKEKYALLKVVAQINNQVFSINEINMEDGQNTISLSKKNLPAGIMQITVFDNNNIPLAERLLFIENYSFEKINVLQDTINIKQRGKNTISFTIDSIKPSLSIGVTSVIDDANYETYEENIASAFLLSSDLKGTINNPGYYFKNKESSTLKHLDLLLMTQGWRRFEWQKITAGNYSKIIYPVESSIYITGKVFKSDRTIPVTDGFVSFIINGEDSSKIIANAKVTDKGEFILSDLFFKKKATILYQGTNNKKEKLIVDVKLNASYIDSLKKSANIPISNLDTVDINNRKSEFANFIFGNMKSEKYKDAVDLGNVTIVATKKNRIDSLNDEYAKGLFSMGLAIDPTEYKHIFTIWQMLQQAVPGITIEGNPFDPTVYFNRFRGLNSLSENSSSTTISSSSDGSVNVGINLQENGIAYFLNEINVDKDVINTLSVDDIALIKVLKNEAAVLGANMGAIVFYTKKGVSISKSIYDKSYTKVDRDGFALVRQFYSPDYSNPEILRNNSVDKRYTVYWNSQVIPTKDGKYKFSFYNNDFAKKLRLLIQGIDKNGQLYFYEQILQ